ncbi:hypothetical protein GGR52DRAFT_131927 [Hypoxylon sp. FL1284]|nr:hypothetical protein GGR52DRAFT_131927 [Hypoxylon sp. FL1284]
MEMNAGSGELATQQQPSNSPSQPSQPTPTSNSQNGTPGPTTSTQNAQGQLSFRRQRASRACEECDPYFAMPHHSLTGLSTDMPLAKGTMRCCQSRRPVHKLRRLPNRMQDPTT